MKPDFFIVGAPKAGTTALHAHLDIHPQVVMSSIKEPNYFAKDLIDAQNLYYDSYIVRTEEEYLKLFNANSETKVTGESSVSYLFYPGIAEKIRNYNPDAKIIILLREPVERALSHYQMDSSLGLVNVALETIFNKPDKYPIHFQQYFQLGLYASQVNAYLSQFDKHVFIRLHDDLKMNTEKLLNELSIFLSIDPWKMSVEMKAKNETTAGRNVLVRKLYASSSLRTLIRIIPAENSKSWLKKIFFSKSNLPVMQPEIKSRLKDFYRQDIIQLEKLINRDLSTWKQ